MAAKGLAKLIEEMGEAQQVAGKMLAWWNTDEPHWDGSSLKERMAEELGDVIAAAWLVASSLEIADEVLSRYEEKDQLFEAWGSDPTNNDHGIDAPCWRPHVVKAPMEDPRTDW